MTSLRQASVRAAMERADATPAAVEDPPRRDRLEYLTLLEAIDAAIARNDDEAGTARIQLQQTYATVWAVIGYGLWVGLELAWRVFVLLAHLAARLLRRRDEPEDDGWTTTMKRKGRVK